MSEQFDNILTGIIILLVILVVWKWYGNNSECDSGETKLSCGCNLGKCMCQKARIHQSNAMGGNQRVSSRYSSEGMTDNRAIPMDSNGVITSAPTDSIDVSSNDSYSETTKNMGLEQEVSDSHKRYVNDLYSSGLPTGASAASILEETGRSYGTADYHGLTKRKWCKARQMATPADGSRVVPSHDILENCNITLTDLV